MVSDGAVDDSPRIGAKGHAPPPGRGPRVRRHPQRSLRKLFELILHKVCRSSLAVCTFLFMGKGHRRQCLQFAMEEVGREACGRKGAAKVRSCSGQCMQQWRYVSFKSRPWVDLVPPSLCAARSRESDGCCCRLDFSDVVNAPAPGDARQPQLTRLSVTAAKLPDKPKRY